MKCRAFEIPLHLFDYERLSNRKKLVKRNDKQKSLFCGYSQQQRIAICEETGVLAIANGTLVDLYHLGNLSLSEGTTTTFVDALISDSKKQKQQLHLPFLTQIQLNDFTQEQQNSSINIQKAYATSLLFVEKGVLFVGAPAVSIETNDSSNKKETETVSSSWLFGFRLYLSAGTHSPSPSSVVLHLAFLEQMATPGQASEGIFYMEKRPQSSLNAGAVLLLAQNSNCFAILKWKERLSDRWLCVGKIESKGAFSPLLAASMNEKGEFLVCSDTNGGVFLLDMRNFPWETEANAGFAPLISQLDGKRVQSIALSHSGVEIPSQNLLSEANPMDFLRVVYAVAGCGELSFL